jgi:hypothetical protein
MLAGTVVSAVTLILAISLVQHLMRPSELLRALRAQAVIPSSVAPLAAAALVLSEGCWAFLLGAGLVWPEAGWLMRPALVGCAVQLAGYAAYLLSLLRRYPTREIPCGCSGGDVPVSRWVVYRAASVSLLAAVGATWAGEIVRPVADVRFWVPAAAGLTLALLLWHLPMAMADPLRRNEEALAP